MNLVEYLVWFGWGVLVVVAAIYVVGIIIWTLDSIRENGMFNKKRIEKLEDSVKDLGRCLYGRRDVDYQAFCEKDALFQVTIKKMYELAGYEVKFVSCYSLLAAPEDVEGWVLLDKNTSEAVYYRKKKESNG